MLLVELWPFWGGNQDFIVVNLGPMNTNYCERFPSCIRCWGSNSQRFTYESPPLTTVPWLPPYLDQILPQITQIPAVGCRLYAYDKFWLKNDGSPHSNRLKPDHSDFFPFISFFISLSFLTVMLPELLETPIYLDLIPQFLISPEKIHKKWLDVACSVEPITNVKKELVRHR